MSKVNNLRDSDVVRAKNSFNAKFSLLEAELRGSGGWWQKRTDSKPLGALCRLMAQHSNSPDKGEMFGEWRERLQALAVDHPYKLKRSDGRTVAPPLAKWIEQPWAKGQGPGAN